MRVAVLPKMRVRQLSRGPHILRKLDPRPQSLWPWGAVGSEFPKMRAATREIVPLTTRWVARAGTKMKRRAFSEAVVCVASHAGAADPRFSGAPMEGGRALSAESQFEHPPPPRLTRAFSEEPNSSGYAHFPQNRCCWRAFSENCPIGFTSPSDYAYKI